MLAGFGDGAGSSHPGGILKRDLRTLTMPLLVLVAFNLLPGFYLRPLWSSALCFVFLGYRFFVEATQIKLPPRWTILVAQVVVGVAIWQHYNSIFGDEAAGTLLTLLTCLKTFELRIKRDYFVNSMLCFMVLMSNLLLDQSLLLTLYVVGDVILIVSFLYALESETFNWKGVRTYLKPTLGLALKAVPLLVVCFVLFPRFTTGFGTGNQTVGKTGITDELRPGSVSQLISSEELVFRAHFKKGEVPPKNTLYWRGAVLEEARGLDWSRDKTPLLQAPPLHYGANEEIEIFLEPGFERFVFSLESTHTVAIPNDFNRTRVSRREGGIFELSQPLQNRERYVLHNIEDSFLEEKNRDIERYLRTQEPPSREMRKLLSTLRGKSGPETVANVLQLFRGNGFEYSMQPPPASGIDEFIFQNKSGFCEHYAASLATMLRQMDVPARVVVGFQGGTPSFLENYISVRGQDAHAWVEYLDRRTNRWHRVDPTAQVAPARLALGSESYLADSQNWLPSWLIDSNRAYRRMRALVDEVEASWIGFLLRFDLARQKELLAKFGMEETLFRALPVFLLLAVALILSVLYFLEAQRREVLTTEERLYRDVIASLKKFKIERTPADGPLTLMNKVRGTSPLLAEKVAPILETLILARFGGHKLTHEEGQNLARQVRQFRKLHSKSASR